MDRDALHFILHAVGLEQLLVDPGEFAGPLPDQGLQLLPAALQTPEAPADGQDGQEQHAEGGDAQNQTVWKKYGRSSKAQARPLQVPYAVVVAGDHPEGVAPGRQVGVGDLPLAGLRAPAAVESPQPWS